MRRIDFFLSKLYAINFLTAAIALLPLLTVLLSWMLPAEDHWQHLSRYVLPGVLVNSVIVVIGVLGLTAGLGISLAWLTACVDFPGRRFFSMALVAPLCLPAYVTGFVYIGIFDYAGPVMTGLRAWGFGGEGGFAFRGLGGLIFTLSLALYPYVYFIVRQAFVSQGHLCLNSARALGQSPWSVFTRVMLPLSRPWIVMACSLVSLEVLADFGTVNAFSIDTFTTAIYKTWFGFFSLAAAAQLASLLLMMVGVFFLIERWSVRGRRFHSVGSAAAALLCRYQPGSLGRWGIFLYCALILAVGFVIPVVQLMYWVAELGAWASWFEHLKLLQNSLLLGLLASVLIVVAATSQAMGKRLARRNYGDVLRVIACSGYAVPGTVLAVGLFIPLNFIQQNLERFLENYGGIQLGMLFTGSILAVTLGLLIRFFAVGYASIGSALTRVSPRIDEAAAALGASKGRAFWKVHLPLLVPTLATALILVFVDVIKEMPLTVMTRPFGWDTLAVRIFEMTSEGEWKRAAFAALLLGLAGLIPVVLMASKLKHD